MLCGCSLVRDLLKIFLCWRSFAELSPKCSILNRFKNPLRRKLSGKSGEIMSWPLRLLIVEDSKDDADLLVRAVRSAGYVPVYEIVDTAPAMRDALKHDDWDLIISDCALPRFAAPAALALAKELRPDLPFIVLSVSIAINLAA